MAEEKPNHGALFLAFRVLAVILMLLCWGIFATSIIVYPKVVSANPAMFAPDNYSPAEMDILMGQIGSTFRSYLQWNRFASTIFAVFFSLVGIFLFLHKGNDWFGLFLAVTFVQYGTLYGSSTGIVASIFPDLEPLLTPLGVMAWVNLFIIMFLFPSGRFVPCWTWLVVAGLLIAFGIDIFVYEGRTPPLYIFLPIFAMVMVGPASQYYRYRYVSTPIERQQTKLVMLSMVFVIFTLLFSAIPFIFGLDLHPDSPHALFFTIFNGFGLYVIGVIPLSIALAILRYQLWDIDLVIRRTLSYTILTSLLGLTYFGLVTLLQSLFLGASRQQSPLALVVSTLAIAVLFTPLRRRIQLVIDQRFFRQRYDMTSALEGFSQNLRFEVDLPAIERDLIIAVNETIQPEAISLWIRKVEKR